MNNKTTMKHQAEYILETSWEVCNKVGGIYTVLSTRAASLQKTHKDKVVFFGPDVWGNTPNPYFTPIKQKEFLSWKKELASEGLNIQVGRWKIPGKPIAVLVDFKQFFEQKNEIYGKYWNLFGVNSIAAYGDYDEASMFGYAAGVAMESFYKYFKLTEKNPVAAHFNEWMTSFGLFYIKEKLPQVATLFTTHATSIGRSIAGNNKPLYNHLNNYNGDQMAQELNMVSKHSCEKQAAHLADCFTTVSDITDLECAQLLDKKADIVTPNGFEAGFVHKGRMHKKTREDAREKLTNIANCLLSTNISENAMFVITSGRYEYKNKGIDVFINALAQLEERQPQREIVAFIVVPAHISGARNDLKQALLNPNQMVNPANKYTTHELYDYNNDPVLSALRWCGLQNAPENKVKVIFVPAYIAENDELFGCSYYDLLVGFDLSVFPSYYEPWGYTPLESIAFQIPTITTSLSGFGQWAKIYSTDPTNGVGIVNRTDSNYDQVVKDITDMILHYSTLNEREVKITQLKAADISRKALWNEFIKYYYTAYSIALEKNKEKK